MPDSPADSSVDVFDKRFPAVYNGDIPRLQTFDAAGHEMHDTLNLSLGQLLSSHTDSNNAQEHTLLLSVKEPTLRMAAFDTTHLQLRDGSPTSLQTSRIIELSDEAMPICWFDSKVTAYPPPAQLPVAPAVQTPDELPPPFGT